MSYFYRLKYALQYCLYKYIFKIFHPLKFQFLEKIYLKYN